MAQLLRVHLACGQEEVADAFETHYTQLFREQDCVSTASEMLLHRLAPISEEMQDLIKAPIRELEVRRVIMKMSGNKAPGPEEIGAEFYKKHVNLLCLIVAKAFQDIFERKLHPPTMRESLTVLIPKKTTRKSDPGVTDFRPIRLCGDYKILVKILVKRLDLGLGCVVVDHQTYGLRGRSIARNLHAMRIVREPTREGHQPLAVFG